VALIRSIVHWGVMTALVHGFARYCELVLSSKDENIAQIPYRLLEVFKGLSVLI
jgi:hypothetical protein